jgi:hypothetical protein
MNGLLLAWLFGVVFVVGFMLGVLFLRYIYHVTK